MFYIEQKKFEILKKIAGIILHTKINFKKESSSVYINSLNISMFASVGTYKMKGYEKIFEVIDNALNLGYRMFGILIWL
jgi:hypothetical protein